MINNVFNYYITLFGSKLKMLLSLVIVFLIPIKPLLLIVALMIVCDTIIGIWRAKKLGVKIASKALSAIVSKLVLYQSSVILIFILEKHLLSNFFTSIFVIELFLTKIVATTLCGIELMSINESYKIVVGFDLWDKLKLILKRSKSFKEELNELVDDLKEDKPTT